MNKKVKNIAIVIAIAGAFSLSGLAQASADSIKGYFNDHGWWSANAEWAKDNGLMNGIGNGQFGGDDMVTRGQLATVLKNLSDTGKFGGSSYDDSALKQQIQELQKEVADLKEQLNKQQTSATTTPVTQPTTPTPTPTSVTTTTTTPAADTTTTTTPAADTTVPVPQSQQLTNIGAVTMAQYQQLKQGMTKEQVVSILGSNYQITSSGNYGDYGFEVLDWTNPDSSWVSVNLENGKVTSINQMSLK